MSNDHHRPARKSYARIPDVLPLPPLIEVQHHSYGWFREEGLRALFDEISPIVSFNKNLELHFGDFCHAPKWGDAATKQSFQGMGAPKYNLGTSKARRSLGTRNIASAVEYPFCAGIAVCIGMSVCWRT